MRHIWLSSVTVIALAACVTTPQPISEHQAGVTAVNLQPQIPSSQEPLNDAITLYESMARASKCNLDTRLIAVTLRNKLLAKMKQAATHIYASMGDDPYGADIHGDEDAAPLPRASKCIGRHVKP